MSDTPGVTLDFEKHWCAVHLEPFRHQWPAGAASAMLLLFDAAVRDSDIVAYAQGNSGNLDLALGEFAPICCHVDRKWPGLLGEIADTCIDGEPGRVAILRHRIRQGCA